MARVPFLMCGRHGPPSHQPTLLSPSVRLPAEARSPAQMPLRWVVKRYKLRRAGPGLELRKAGRGGFRRMACVVRPGCAYQMDGCFACYR
jgi:hypothetical protein